MPGPLVENSYEMGVAPAAVSKKQDWYDGGIMLDSPLSMKIV